MALIFSVSWCSAHENAIVDHHDPIQIDKTLTLDQVIRLTLQHYPDFLLVSARDQEAIALQQRGNSWLAAPPRIALRYEDDFPGDDIGSREIEAELELPLWNWGQRSAGQHVAAQALNSAAKQAEAIRLEVAGLVRRSLWQMAIAKLHYQQVKDILTISTKLLGKIKRRVALGDLSRVDLLLAQSEHLQNTAKLVQAEASMMQVRKHYTSLTQMTVTPADYHEELSVLTDITEAHPVLLAMDAVVQRKQAELLWTKATGSGQSSFILGGKSEKDAENGDDIESMSVEISIPFGGSAHLQAEIATVNLILTELLAQRAHLFRKLEKQWHEAKHALEVSRVELAIAKELKQLAEEHLAMTQLSFSEGEIGLMELLKVQLRSNDAIFYAQEQEVRMQMRIALYNQSVGVIP